MLTCQSNIGIQYGGIPMCTLMGTDSTWLLTCYPFPFHCPCLCHHGSRRQQGANMDTLGDGPGCSCVPSGSNTGTGSQSTSDTT
eukprot:3013433-Amphidinium_carterae.1